MNKNVGIIGFGNMGSAIAEQLALDYQIYVFDKDNSKTVNASGIKVAQANADLVNKVDTIILAIKPQEFQALLGEIKDSVSADKLIISIAAGISTAYIEKYLGVVRVIRAMPNIAVRIGSGVTCLAKGKLAADKDLEFAENLFGYMGETLTVKEEMMNAVTAISGSGPGYYFDIIDSNIDAYKNNSDKLLKDFIASLSKSAEGIGFTHEEASFLAIGTGNASESLLIKTKLPPSELKKQVTSKGGTTEAGLEVLHKGGSLEEAVKAALKRAEELSTKE